jgi:hypothetical protein
MHLVSFDWRKSKKRGEESVANGLRLVRIPTVSNDTQSAGIAEAATAAKDAPPRPQKQTKERLWRFSSGQRPPI